NAQALRSRGNRPIRRRCSVNRLLAPACARSEARGIAERAEARRHRSGGRSSIAAARSAAYPVLPKSEMEEAPSEGVTAEKDGGVNEVARERVPEQRNGVGKTRR